MATGKSGSAYISNANFRARVDWTETYDRLANASVVSITGLYLYTPSYTGSFVPIGTVKVNGETVVTMTADAVYTHAASLSAGSYVKVGINPSSAIAENYPWVSGAIVHNADGSKSVSITLDLTGGCTTTDGKFYNLTFSGSQTIALTDIPRRSTLTCNTAAESQALGSPLSFSIAKEDSSFTDTLTYQCGSVSGTILSESTEASTVWTPPVTLAQQNASGNSVSVTFTLTTYSADTSVGSTSITLILAIPQSVVPTLFLSVSDVYGYFAKYGAYVQGKSALDVELTAAGAQGSTIVTCSASFDECNYTGESFLTDVIKGTGSLTLTATAQDSRGRTTTVTRTLSVLAYAPPTVSELTVQRCNANGTANAKGAYFKVTFNAVITPLSNKNAARYTLQYKKRTENSYSYVTLSSYTGSYQLTGAVALFSASVASSYDVIITAADDFTSFPKSAVGFAVKKLWSILNEGLGFAFGKVAERENTLDMGFSIYMNGNKIENLPEPVNPSDAATKNYVDAQIAELRAAMSLSSE